MSQIETIAIPVKRVLSVLDRDLLAHASLITPTDYINLTLLCTCYPSGEMVELLPLAEEVYEAQVNTNMIVPTGNIEVYEAQMRTAYRIAESIVGTSHYLGPIFRQYSVYPTIAPRTVHHCYLRNGFLIIQTLP